MDDTKTIIERIRPEVERDLKQMRAKADHLAVCIGIVLVGFFVFFLFISDPPPPLFSIFYLILGIVAYFGLRDRFLKVINPAIEERLRFLDHEPETARELADRAEIFAEYGQADAAVADYREAVLEDPDDPSIRYGFSLLLWRLERGDEALEFLEKITPISSDFQALACFLRARILARRDSVQAEKGFNRALEIDPEEYEFHIGRAEFYLDAERYNEAEADMNEASKRLRSIGLSETGELCRLRGLLELKRGDAAGAVKAFSRATRVDPGNAPLYFRLRAEAYDALGDHRQAEIDRRHAEEE